MKLKEHELATKLSYCPKCENLKDLNDFIKKDCLYSFCSTCGHDSFVINKKHIALADLLGIDYQKADFVFTDTEDIKQFNVFYLALLEIRKGYTEALSLYNELKDYTTKEKLDYLKIFKTDRYENSDRHRQRELTREKSDICNYCGLDGCGSVDHVIPIAFGGVNDLSNMVISCGLCNQLKGSLDVKDYLNYYNTHKYLFDKRIELINSYRVFDKKILILSKEIKELNKELLNQGLKPSKDYRAIELTVVLNFYRKQLDNIGNELQNVISVIKKGFTLYSDYVIVD